LEKAAASNHRSLSEEIEARLELSLRDEGLLDQALDLKLGQQAAGLVLALIRVIENTGSYSGFHSTRTLDGAKNWLGNPYAYSQVVNGVLAVLEGLRPEGDPETGEPKLREPGDPDRSAVFAHLGRGFANGVLEALANPERGGEIGDWAVPVRARLGPEVAKRISDATGQPPFKTVPAGLRKVRSDG
jgi:hypothetical protein